MLIEIGEFGTQILGIVPEEKMLSLLKSAIYLGILNHNRLDKRIHQQFIIEDDAVYLPKYWAGHICRDGGWYKSEFVNLQIQAFELWEEFHRGELKIDIFVHGKEYEFNTKKPIPHEIKDTKQMIKMYKRIHRTSRKGCTDYVNVPKEKHSQLCCLCGCKDIKILRRKEK